MAGLLKSFKKRSTRQSDATVVKRASRNQVITPTIKGGTSLLDRISSINALVSSKLGKYEDEYLLLRTDEEVVDYIDKIIEIGEGAIDTETDSLNPMLCTLAGICLYAPTLKPAYIPVNHVSYITGARTSNQPNEQTIYKSLQKCNNEKVGWVMHNAKFDIRVIKNQLNIEIPCKWDTMLAAKCLNENEPAGLKDLHLKYCKSKDKESLSYDKLFDGIPFTHIPINTGYLYAAGDGVKTFELYEFQKKHLNKDKLPGPYRVFTEIEMPLIPVIADMEDTGMAFDMEYANELSTKYTNLLEQSSKAFFEVLEMYSDEIENYKKSNPGHKLSDPINISSPTQVAIILYDIIGLKSNDKGKPRGTGEDILVAMDDPIANAVLEYRGITKLLSTYIDKMPKIVNPNTGRIHASFNQYGAKTGRLSSRAPNMQNIPSRNKEIRKMFTASEGHLLISGDYSQQEPRALADRSGDEHLIQAYQDDKDIYAWIASFIYHKPYEECMEFRPDGTTNPEGKKRRDSVKNIILGIMYSRGAPAIAEQLGVSVKEAQAIIDKFFNQFPKVKIFIDETVNRAKQTGYVETAWGRKRRLLDMLLPEYEFKYIDGVPDDFDPLAFEQGIVTDELEPSLIIDLTKKLNSCYSYKAKNNIITQLKHQGIKVKDNGGFIAEATRQCVNSVIQGTASDITKRAMILIGNDIKMKELGFKLLLQVHDEVIGEGPEENAKQISERLVELMIEAAREEIKVPMKVDTEITKIWYGERVDV